MTFLERALPTIQRGVPVIRLRPNTKIAFDSAWPSLATTNLAIIETWNGETPNANCAAVAKAELGQFWFFEVDKPEVVQRIESETQQRLPKTFRVRSSPGRGHFYFKQTTASIAMGNIAQSFVKGKDWSARVDAEYVVAANSQHPTSGRTYEIVSIAEIVECPQWLIDWCLSQKITDVKHVVSDNGEAPFPEGSRNASLTSLLGRARQVMRMDAEQLYQYGLDLNEKRCQPPLPDSEVKTIADSVSRYPITSIELLHNGVPVGPVPAGAIQERRETTETPVIPEADEGVKAEPPKYPEFPKWVMYGTSIYEGFVKPFCQVNCRYEEFMFMPTFALLLNYIGTKVYVEGKRSLPLSMYMVLIGRKGKLFKSASVRDAMDYFRIMGVLDQATPNTKTADAKTLVWSAGSPEGFLIDVNRSACKNAVLFYDELTTLTNKASIDTSNMIGSLLTAYEGGKLQNAIKDRKNSYSIEPGTYCISLLTCSTDQDFRNKWSKLSGDDTGLDDRFFFLYQPERLRPMRPFQDVNYLEAALATRKLIDKAVQQGKYKIVDDSPLLGVMDATNPTHAIYADRFGVIDGRCEWRAEKWALAFAIDLNRDEIDEECIERGLALSKYENEVKTWMRTFQAETREGRIQQEVMHHLGQAGGQITKRELERRMHTDRFGTSLWWSAYSGLIKNGWAHQAGAGTKANPFVLIQLRAVEVDE
jgi:hypothetical protein